MLMLRVAGFEKESFTDGVGIRYVIFTQGCVHNCVGCHNPQTHSFKGGALFKIDTIIEDIKKCDYVDGITLSGGDPFHQAKACSELLHRIKKELSLSVWCYTGFKFEDLVENNSKYIQKMLSNIDILIDGRYIVELKSLNHRFIGSTNQRIIDVQKSLKTKTTIIMEGEK